MAPGSQDQPDLAVGRGNVRLIFGFCVNAYRSARAIHPLMKGNRYHRPVILRLAENRALLRSDTNDFEGAVVDDQRFADWVNKRKQIIRNIRTDNTYIARMFYVVFQIG